MRCFSSTLAVLAASFVFSLGGCQMAHNATDHAFAWLPSFHKKTNSPQPAPVLARNIRTKELTITVQFEPTPVKLSETRRVEAVIRVKNISKRFVQLDFPTTQRFDLIVRDGAGKAVAQWSEDQTFEPEPGLVGINPREQVEYRAFFPTRDLQPGKRYIVTVVISNHNDLTTELGFVAEK